MSEKNLHNPENARSHEKPPPSSRNTRTLGKTAIKGSQAKDARNLGKTAIKGKGKK